jgi:hypothetical protein
MKKGFTLILLLVATVIVLGVAPAMATAPPVGNLPRIVFGDSGEIEHAFDLDEYIDWFGIRTTGTVAFNQEVDMFDPEEGFHVYLSDGVTGPAPVTAWDIYSTQPISTKLIGGDLLGLATPLLPILNEEDKNIYRENGRHWLSLTNDTVGAVTTIYLGAYVKSDITTGSIQSFQAVSVAGAPSMAQYGRDFSGFGYSDFSNWDQDPRAGQGYYPAVLAASVSNSFMAWDANATRDANAVAWGVSTPFLPGEEGGHAMFIPYDGGVGLVQPVFEMKTLMRLDTTQTEYKYTPGYRLEILNGGQTHLATMTNVFTFDLALTPPNGPYAGNDYAFTARMYWETPRDMSEMGDGEGVSAYTAGGNAPNDGRDYSCSWDIIDGPNFDVDGTNDAGILELVVLSIRTFEGGSSVAGVPQSDGDLVYTPHLAADGTTPAAWDASEIGEWDLNARIITMLGWNDGVVQGVNGMAFGNLLPEVGSPVLADGLRIWAHDERQEPGNMSTLRYEMAVPDPGSARNRVPIIPDTLLCGAIQVQSEDVETAPIFRLTHSQSSWNGGVPIYRQIGWEEIWGAPGQVYKNPLIPRPVDGVGDPLPAPGVPPVAGTTLHTYLWTHKVNVVPAVADEFTVPELQIYSLGLYGPRKSNDWADETGYYEFRGIAYYSVDTDQSDSGPLAGVSLNPLYDPPAIP